MTIEYNITAGLGIIAAILAYISFRFLDRDVPPSGNGSVIFNWDRLIGMMFFLLTIIFLNMIMYTILLIAQNNALTYLNDTVLRVGLIAVMWSTLGGLGLYLFGLLLGSGKYLYDQVHSWFVKDRRRKKGDLQ